MWRECANELDQEPVARQATGRFASRGSRQSMGGDAMVHFWVYITGSHTGTLHVGVAGDLDRRLARRREADAGRLLPRRGFHRLLYAEKSPDVFAAIARAKQVKGWPRSRRIQLIAQDNPSWRDLAPSSLRKLAARPPDRRPLRQT